MRAARSRSVLQRQFSVEKLEDRSLMAGNVTAAVQAGVLVITGDASDNGVTVDYVQATNTYRVIGVTPSGGTATTINGLDTSVPANIPTFTGVTKGININLNAGNDTLSFGSDTSSTFVVVGDLNIDAGVGNDTVTIGRNGNNAGGAAPIENEVNVSKNLNVVMGVGNDTLTITNTTVAKNMTLRGDAVNSLPAADGNDTIQFLTTFTPAGGVLTNFPVSVGGKTGVFTGGGADTFNALNFTSLKGMYFEDPTGNLTFDLNDSRVGGEFHMRKNGGTANDISFDNLNAGTLRLDTGNGVDTIAIRDSIFAKLYIDAAGGLDQITIGNTRVTHSGIINGGRERARVTQEAGNALKRVVRVRTFG